MTIRAALTRLLGTDHGGDRYAYVDSAGQGPVAASRAADTWVRTTCGYCSVGCGMLIGVRDGAAVAVRGDPDHPVNRGRLCPKGLSEHQTIAAAGRLTVPRVDGRAATWDAALDRVVDGFQDLIARHGPESVAVLSTGQLVTEEFYALGKLVRLGMGVARRTVEHWHTRTKTGRIPILEGLAPEAWVEIHPGDADRLNVRSGDWVRVSSQRGSVERIRVRVTPIVRRGEVFIPFHWEDTCANWLTDDEFDPISREPNYKQCAVAIARVP